MVYQGLEKRPRILDNLGEVMCLGRLARSTFFDEGDKMCYNCGCHMPDDDMGHPDNITTSTLEALGKSVNKNLHDTQHWVHDYLEAQTNDPEAPKNADIEEMFVKASKAWGQSLTEAKKQTYNMLKSEM